MESKPASSTGSIHARHPALIMKAFIGFCHPMLIAQGLQEGQDLETEARSLIRFLLRAITRK